MSETLYDSIKQLRQHDKHPIYRIMMAGYLSEEFIKRENLNLETYFKKSIEGYEKLLTGYLYVKGAFYLNLIQSNSIDTLNIFLNNYNEFIKKKQSLHLQARIVYQSYENMSRFFPNWDMEVISQPGPVLVQTQKTEQQIADRMFQIYQFLEEGGKKRRQNSSFKLANMMVFSNDDMSLLTSHHFMSLKEYCQLYFKDAPVQKEAESNYPLPPTIFNFIQFLEIDNYLDFH